MKITRNIICDGCKGTGSKSGVSSKCKGCDGNGIRVEVQAQGFMRIQRQVVCPVCKGRGDTVSEADKCTKCTGDRVVQDSKIITVEIQKGMKWNEAVSFYGEADQAPDCMPGALIFVLKPKQPETTKFERKGNDLLLKVDVPLIDALTGIKHVVKHLDDRDILLTYNEPINPSDILVVSNQGMPIVGQPDKFGDLVVQFSIIFPSELSSEQRKALLNIFPRIDPKVPSGTKTYNLKKPKKGKASNQHQYQEENGSEDEGRPQVQCAQQ